MSPALAIGLIGGGLIAVKTFGNKPTVSSDTKNPAYPTGEPNVQANAEQMGYETISQAQYETNGIDAGQTTTVTNDNGEVVGTVTGTEGGNEVFQQTNGTVHIRSSDDAGIEIDPPAPTTIAPSRNTGVAVKSVGPTIGSVVRANVPTLSFTKPKSPVSSDLSDQRMRIAAKMGLRVPG